MIGMSKALLFPKRFNCGFRQYYCDIICPGTLRGIDFLRDSRLNKGLAFTLEERQALGIHGLQPARIKTQDEQVELCKIWLTRSEDPLSQYIYLNHLNDRNERIYYRLICENVKELLPIVYTPTVGLACLKYGLLYRRPKGLFITIHDKGHIYDVLKNWPVTDVRVICVTDGERILGLGDLGASGMGIPIGKLGLCTALAGIKPNLCLPITLDVGTNNQALLEDPLYIGLRTKRISGSAYDEFVDEFMQAVTKRFGYNTLIQFEDFGNKNAFRFLEKYKKKYCMFNDDIQGTGAVAVSGFISSEKISHKPLSDCHFLFFGAGGAAVGIAETTVRALELRGMQHKEACDRIWMFDVDGLLTLSRPKDHLDAHRVKFAKNVPHTKNLIEVIDLVKPTFLIGASTIAGAFSPEILKKMAEVNDRPVIFALSNPTSRAECTAEQAYQHTDGRAIVATGSPFPPVNYGGKTYHPAQSNNAYIFPGIALGVIESNYNHVDDDLFLLGSETVCDYTTEEDLQMGSIFPPLSKVREISICIASRLLQYSYDKGCPYVYPEPVDKMAYIKSKLYDYYYKPSLPSRWNWPEHRSISKKPDAIADYMKKVGEN